MGPLAWLYRCIFHEWSIWIVSFNLFLIMSYYIARVKQLDLQDENI